MIQFEYAFVFTFIGKLDNKTEAQFSVPRCANKDPEIKLDIPGFNDTRRRKRYVHQGSKWTKVSIYLSKKCFISNFKSCIGNF